MGKVNAQAIDALGLAATSDPDEVLRKEAVSALAKICRDTQDFSQLNSFLQTMSEQSGQPKVQMNFNAPVTCVAGNVEGDFIVNPSETELKALLFDVTEFLNTLQQKHSPPTTTTEAIAIINAEYQEIQQTQPWRWQNLLSLKRLFNGSKSAALKVGEHFAEETPWAKGIIGFIEGISEEVE
jgi:hypothetical protein